MGDSFAKQLANFYRKEGRLPKGDGLGYETHLHSQMHDILMSATAGTTLWKLAGKIDGMKNDIIRYKHIYHFTRKMKRLSQCYKFHGHVIPGNHHLYRDILECRRIKQRVLGISTYHRKIAFEKDKLVVCEQYMTELFGRDWYYFVSCPFSYDPETKFKKRNGVYKLGGMEIMLSCLCHIQ